MLPYYIQQIKYFLLHKKHKKLAPPLNQFYEHSMQSLSKNVDELCFVSLDFETTGLDLNNDEVVSVGLVEINQMAVDLSTCWHQIVKVKNPLSAGSVAVHQISDSIVSAEGKSMQDILPTLIEKIQGKILLVHCQPIEATFLNKYCEQFYNTPFIAQYVDTMQLAKSFGRRKGREIEGLRLYHLRNYYNLPTYKAHNALMDSIATAEVFCAQMQDYFNHRPVKLKQTIYY